MWLVRSWNSQGLMWARTPGPTALHPLRRMRLENASSFAGVELSRLQELSWRQGNYTLTRDRTGYTLTRDQTGYTLTRDRTGYTLTRDRTGLLRVRAQEFTDWATWPGAPGFEPIKPWNVKFNLIVRLAFDAEMNFWQHTFYVTLPLFSHTQVRHFLTVATTEIETNLFQASVDSHFQPVAQE